MITLPDIDFRDICFDKRQPLNKIKNQHDQTKRSSNKDLPYFFYLSSKWLRIIELSLFQKKKEKSCEKKN